MPNKLALIKSVSQPVALLAEVRQLILAARDNVARTVNACLVILYWQVGQRIRKDILHDNRAGYGEQIVHALSEQLTVEFGRGFMGADCRRAGATIGAGVWAGIQREEPVEDPSVRGGFPGPEDCRFTDTRIELDSFFAAHPDRVPVRDASSSLAAKPSRKKA